MADDKGKDKGGDKPKGGGGNGNFFLGFLFVVFILWLLTGGPREVSDSRTNAFIRPNLQTYREPLFGQPGSVTNTVPFLR